MSQPAILILLERLLWPVPRVRWEVARSIAHLIRDSENEIIDRFLEWISNRELESEALIPLGIIDAFDLSRFFDYERVSDAINAPSIASDYLVRRNFDRTSSLSLFRYKISPTDPAALPSHQDAWFSRYKYQVVPPYFSLMLAQLEQSSSYPFLAQWEHNWRWIQTVSRRPRPSPFFFFRGEMTGQLDLGLTEVYKSAYLRTIGHAVLLGAITSDEAEDIALHTLTMNRGLADVDPIDRPHWARVPVPIPGRLGRSVVRELWGAARDATALNEVLISLRIMDHSDDGFTEIDLVQTIGPSGFAAGPVDAADVRTIVVGDHRGVMSGSVGQHDPRVIVPIRRPTSLVNIVMPEHVGSVHREMACTVRLASPELFRVHAEVQCEAGEVRLTTTEGVFSRWVHWYSDWHPAMHSDIDSSVSSMTTVMSSYWERLASSTNTQTSVLATVRTASKPRSYSKLELQKRAFWITA